MSKKKPKQYNSDDFTGLSKIVDEIPDAVETPTNQMSEIDEVTPEGEGTPIVKYISNFAGEVTPGLDDNGISRNIPIYKQQFRDGKPVFSPIVEYSNVASDTELSPKDALDQAYGLLKKRENDFSKDEFAFLNDFFNCLYFFTTNNKQTYMTMLLQHKSPPIKIDFEEAEKFFKNPSIRKKLIEILYSKLIQNKFKLFDEYFINIDTKNYNNFVDLLRTLTIQDPQLKEKRDFFITVVNDLLNAYEIDQVSITVGPGLHSKNYHLLSLQAGIMSHPGFNGRRVVENHKVNFLYEQTNTSKLLELFIPFKLNNDYPKGFEYIFHIDLSNSSKVDKGLPELITSFDSIYNLRLKAISGHSLNDNDYLLAKSAIDYIKDNVVKFLPESNYQRKMLEIWKKSVLDNSELLLQQLKDLSNVSNQQPVTQSNSSDPKQRLSNLIKRLKKPSKQPGLGGSKLQREPMSKPMSNQLFAIVMGMIDKNYSSEQILDFLKKWPSLISALDSSKIVYDGSLLHMIATKKPEILLEVLKIAQEKGINLEESVNHKINGQNPLSIFLDSISNDHNNKIELDNKKQTIALLASYDKDPKAIYILPLELARKPGVLDCLGATKVVKRRQYTAEQLRKIGGKLDKKQNTTNKKPLKPK